MNENSPKQTFDIHGTVNSSEKVVARLVGVVGCLGLGILLWSLWLQTERNAETNGLIILAVVAFIIGAVLPYSRHTYLDFTGRQIVTSKHYCGFKLNQHCRPLTDFSNIVVRHLCDSSGEGEPTYTGSVGLKPLYEGPVLWVKSFPTTQDEVPRAAYEFARSLQEMTGLPFTPMGGFKNETP
jgi:hypothetical protein